MVRPTLPSPQIYRLFLCALLVALTVPRMTQRGMFGDGLQYATVARNMSIGVGSLWHPTFTATSMTDYYEHPPAGLALEATAFRVFGDHVAVERLYSLTVFAVEALVIAALWRRLLPASLDWLPLFFWVLPSIVTWAVINNMLENTQTLFTTASVLFLVVARQARTGGAAAAWSTAAALGVVAAVLTKGPVGFFPLVVPLLFLLVPIGQGHNGDDTRTRHLMPMASALLGAVVLCGLLLGAYDPSRHSLTAYLQTQLIPSLQGQRETNADPLATIRHLGLGIVARMVVISALLWIVGRRRAEELSWRPALFFLSLALCASLPVGVSPKLAGHYFLPSVPLFALGFAALTPASALVRPEHGWHRRVPVLLSVGLLMATILVPILRGSLEPRDKDLLQNLDAVATSMPRGIVIGGCRSSSTDWRLQSYVNRFFRVSIEADDAPVNGWLLQSDQSCGAPPPCVATASGDRLVLFRCQAP